MTYNQALIAELQMEAASTRKMLAAVPLENGDYKVHEHSMTIIKLATHVADLPTWISITLNSAELDLATTNFTPSQVHSTEELLALFDKNVAAGIADLEKVTAEDFQTNWTLRRGEHVVFTMPKAAVVRSFAINHMIHHRAQLSVYLRLLNVPVPGMYGPSYDDTQAMKAHAEAAAV
jgi:uncharacterized damage-inducible protein DinB